MGVPLRYGIKFGQLKWVQSVPTHLAMGQNIMRQSSFESELQGGTRKVQH